MAVGDRHSAPARERGPAVVEELRRLGHKVIYVADGDPAGLQADILLLLENLADFGVYCAQLTGATERRPVTAVWMLETLPPESLSARAEAIGLASSQWHYRLGLRRPKRALTPLQKMVSLRNARQWLFKQLSGAGHRRACRLMMAEDPRLADTHWSQVSGALQNWERLRRARMEGWLDHCIVSTQQRQRFLQKRGWQVPFVPVGSQAGEGCRRDGPRDLDVVFLGYLRRDRRVNLLATLKQELAARRIGLEIVTNHCFGETRARLLSRTRILLMLHQYSWSPAWIRFVHAGMGGACIVSEPVVDDQPFQPGVHYAAAPCDAMPELIERLLGDHRERERLVAASFELCTTSLTLHHSVRQIADLVLRPSNQ